ncbi:putative strictosidine synthase transcription factor WD40-like family [Rosa chinensis]|uniref:Putative strictosidine synthase transcription factor WD40-like family n=1 Tax=Rosa chinensis TaxID=74649 RepID=A0A2P6RLD4_ROSCH|nr:protein STRICTOSIDINE SYNTHASE-LIKE 5 [Rosa chinensis]PRQ47250.1 putative strictosidine synthase transcription factor WD40-like family [Rosa chinensis]
MPESNNHNSPSPSTQASRRSSSSSSWPLNFLLFSILVPVAAALVILYQLDPFDPAPLPLHELSHRVTAAPAHNAHMLKGSEFIGAGALVAPEDVAYDSKSGLIYTGCADGWVKRVTLNESAADSVVENWVNTGGRPLGLAHGHNGQLLVADTEKGLLSISEDGEVELLTDEAEGVKFKLTDAVDVAKDGMIYFTDASYKYSLKDFIWDVLEGKPHGRLLSYDPTIKETKVLVPDLYFGNGVAVSPDQNFVIFCETVMRRCKKYYLQGKKKGNVENFIDNLPGTPDNIRYDGEGHYWIAFSTEITDSWNLALRFPFIRKWLAIMEKYTTGRPHMEKNSGVMAVNLEGEPIAHYFDPGLSLISSGIKIGNYLYCGSIIYPYIIRFDLERHPAHATT